MEEAFEEHRHRAANMSQSSTDSYIQRHHAKGMAMLDKKLEALRCTVSSRVTSESQACRLKARSPAGCLVDRIKTLEGYLIELESLREYMRHRNDALYQSTIRNCLDELSSLREGIVVTGDRFDATANNTQRLKDWMEENRDIIQTNTGSSDHPTNEGASLQPTDTDTSSLPDHPTNTPSCLATPLSDESSDEGYWSRRTSQATTVSFQPDLSERHRWWLSWASNSGLEEAPQERCISSSTHEDDDSVVDESHSKEEEAEGEGEGRKRLSRGKMRYDWTQGLEWWQVSTKPWIDVKL
jgi:hypothetical protein